jgi:hypothetical protein
MRRADYETGAAHCKGSPPGAAYVDTLPLWLKAKTNYQASYWGKARSKHANT